MERLLVLCRHGQSEWNLENLFTVWKDPGLTALGVSEARAGGKRLAAMGLSFDIAFTSALSRAQITCELLLEEMGLAGLPTIRDWHLMSVTMVISPASTKRKPPNNGAMSRSTSGAAHSTCRRRVVKASR